MGPTETSAVQPPGKKTAALVAPPKFREETSKKAVRRSASASHRLAFAGAACKGYLLRRTIFFHLLDSVAFLPQRVCQGWR